MKTFEGNLVAEVSRFNEFITSRLLGGALDGLKRRGVREEDIQTAWVPGAFEIPLIASKMAKSGKYDAVICLGAVIRGSTSHYDYVCNESPPRTSSRPSSAPAARRATRAPSVPRERWRW